MKTKRHKHNWCIYFAKTEPEAEAFENIKLLGTNLFVNYSCGCAIRCSICGKEKKRLSKKIAKYYANTQKPYLEDFIREQIEIYIPRQSRPLD